MASNSSPMTPAALMREMSFGDVPLAQWRPTDEETLAREPWAGFERARQALGNGDRQGAAAALIGIVNQPDLESRQYLQAWQGLREIGVKPPPQMGRQLYGVIIEVDQPQGLDVLVAYADFSARYINYSGRMTLWNTRTPAMDARISRLLEASSQVLPKIGPWEGQRPGPPPRGQVRINLLTSDGLCFGQGPWDALSRDGLGGPVLGAAAQLLKALVETQLAR